MDRSRGSEPDAVIALFLCLLALSFAPVAAIGEDEGKPTLAGDLVAPGDTAGWVGEDTLLIISGKQAAFHAPGKPTERVPLPPATALDPSYAPVVGPAPFCPFALVARVQPLAKAPLMNVVVQNPDGTTRHALMTSALIAADRLAWGDWSSDGLELAYSAEKRGVAPQEVQGIRLGDGKGERTTVTVPHSAIWTVRMDTGEERQLTSTPECDDSSPSFSPDGKTIAFQRVYPGQSVENWELMSTEPLPVSSIVLLDRATGELRELTSKALDQRPAFSPDGTQIAFIRYEPSVTSIWLVDVAGGGTRRLLSDALFVGGLMHTHLAWSPDGRYVLFACDGDLYAAPTAGGLPVRLTRGAALAEPWELSPLGDKVCFARGGSVYTLPLAWPTAPDLRPPG